MRRDSWVGFLVAAAFMMLLSLFVLVAYQETIPMPCCGWDIGTSPWPQQAPAQFNHVYRGHLTTHYVTQEEIQARCGPNTRACAYARGASCVIYLPAPTPAASPEVLAALRAHEIAHCNGWPATHPNM